MWRSHNRKQHNALRFFLSMSLTAKVKEIRSQCKWQEMSIHQVAYIIVDVNSPRTPLHYRSLKKQKKSEAFTSTTLTSFENQSVMDLNWWISNLNGRPIHLGLTSESNASNTGWGPCWNNHKTGNHWSAQESQPQVVASCLSSPPCCPENRQHDCSRFIGMSSC